MTSRAHAAAPARIGSTGPLSLRGVLLERSLWLLCLGVVLFFRASLTTGTLFHRDLHNLNFPLKAHLVRIVSNGELPLWLPLLHGGQPFLENPNYTLFSPSNVLYFVLPLTTAFNVDIVLHFVLAALFTYCLARFLGASEKAAFLAGAVFAFCGYTASTGNGFHPLVAMPYLPLRLLFWHRYLTEGRKSFLLVSVLAGAVQLAVGFPELSAFAALLLFAWPAALASSRREFLRGAGKALLCVIFVAGLGAVSLLPALRIVKSSARGEARTFESFSVWSVHPRRLPELGIPGFFGRTATLDQENYWGRHLEDEGFPYVLSIYFGFPSLLLSACALRCGPGRRVPERFWRVLAGVALAGIVLSLGRFLPGLREVYGAFPVIGVVRFPVKALALSVLPVALLSARGLDGILEADPRAYRALKLARSLAFGVSFLLAIPVLLDSLAPSVARAAASRWFQTPARDSLERGLGSSFLQAFGVCTLFTAILLSRLRSETKATAMAALAALDLCFSARNVNPVAPRALFDEVPPLASAVDSVRGQGRLFRDDEPGERTTAAVPADDVALSGVEDLFSLRHYSAFFYGIPVIFHLDFDDLAPRRIVLLGKALRELPWERRGGILAASGVSAVVSDDELPVSLFEPAGTFRTLTRRPHRLYRVREPAPTVFVPASWEPVSSGEDALALLRRDDFDPRRRTVVEGPGASEGSCEGASLEVLSVRSNSSAYRLRASRPCLLVFSETYDDRFVTEIDGREVPQLVANFAFTAVTVPPGDHRVSRRYRPRDLLAGLLVSLGTGAALLLFTLRRPATGPGD